MLKIGNKVIAKKIVFRDNFWQKGTGLMFKKKPINQAYIFRFNKPKIIGVTMMFVFYPIDLVFLNQKNEVVELKQKIKPFSHYIPKKEATTLIELEDGSIKKYKIKIGQKVFW